MLKARIVVLLSGNGSNLQALIDACQSGSLPADIVAVISNKAEAFGLSRASRAGLKTLVVPFDKSMRRVDYDHSLAEVVASFAPDWVILAGWMRILSNAFLASFPNKVVNLHPALPGTFPGIHAIERAFQAWQEGKIDHTGVMVHLVPDEGVDDGPLLGQSVILIEPEDTLQSFEARVHEVEHDLLVEITRQLIIDGLERTIENAKSDSIRAR